MYLPSKIVLELFSCIIYFPICYLKDFKSTSPIFGEKTSLTIKKNVPHKAKLWKKLISEMGRVKQLN